MIQSPCLKCGNRENDKDEEPCASCKLLAALQAEDSRRYREDIVYRAQVRGFPSAVDDGEQCRVSGCSAPVLAKGLCSAHYQAARRRERGLAARRPPEMRMGLPAGRGPVPSPACPRAGSPARPGEGRKP